MNTFRDNYRHYAHLHWPIVPLHRPTAASGCSCRRGNQCPAIGKHPRTRHGLRDATTNDETLERWAATWPDANIGVATGPGAGAAGIAVIDIDGERGMKSLAVILEPASLDAPSVKTGNGVHFYFECPPMLKNSASVIGPSIDVRGRGGLIVLPPSRHASGAKYLWQRELSLPLPPFPDWAVERLVKPSASFLSVGTVLPTPMDGLAQIQIYIDQIASAPEGQRNSTLNRSAFIGFKVARRTNCCSFESMAQAMLLASRACGLPEQEAAATIQSALAAAFR